MKPNADVSNSYCKNGFWYSEFASVSNPKPKEHNKYFFPQVNESVCVRFCVYFASSDCVAKM